MMLKRVNDTVGFELNVGRAYCFLDKPVSLGPERVPKNSLVVMIKSVRR